MKIVALGFVISAVMTSSVFSSPAFISQIGPNATPVSTQGSVSLESLVLPSSQMLATVQSVRQKMSGRSENLLTVHQAGTDNVVEANQFGLTNFGLIEQTGRKNAVSLMQRGNNNLALLSQIGQNNSIRLSQTGNNHAAVVMQQGRGNVAIIAQR